MNGSIEAGGWRVEFFRLADRVAQRIFRETASGWNLVAESLEGTSDEAWPPSPPFQQVHFEPRDDGSQVALLVGMAGRSHWSASVEIDPVDDVLRWDVACRTSDVPSWLGAKYQFALPAEATGAQLRFHIGDLHAVAILQDGNGEALPAVVAGNQLQWSVPAAASQRAQTIRWRYAFKVETSEPG